MGGAVTLAQPGNRSYDGPRRAVTRAAKTRSVRLDADLWRSIEIEAARAGVSASQWAREALLVSVAESAPAARQPPAEIRTQARAFRSDGQQARRQSELLRRGGHTVMQADLVARFDLVFRATADFKAISDLAGGSRVQPFTCWLAGHVHPGDRGLVLDTVDRAIADTAVFEVEHRILRADGTTGLAVSRGAPLLGPTGQVSEWLVASGDVIDVATIRRRVARHLHPWKAGLAARSCNTG